MTFAPIDAEYLTLAANGVLTDYRILNVGSMIIAVDNGPGGTLDINVAPAAVPHNSLDELTTGDPHTQYLLGTILSANGDLLTRVAGSPAALAIGSAGQVLGVSSGLPAWVAPPLPAGAYFLPDIPSARYLTAPGIASNPTTLALTANRLYFTPVQVVKTQTFDRISFNVTGTAAGSARLGIFGPFSGSWTSLPLVLDAGTISAASTGQKDITISQQLTPGWYLLAMVTDNTPTVSARNTGALVSPFGQPDVGASNLTVGAFYAYTYAALPSPSTTAPTYSNASSPHIGIRAA